MTRLLMLVEGQSEEIFVKRTLAPFLAERGIYVSPIILWTKRNPSGGGFRGGACDWQQIRKSLLPLTRDANAWVTTLLDFYGLPEDFPGYLELRRSGDCRAQVVALQERFATEIDHSRFVPFFALHEFEAWLFCSPEMAAEHFGQPRVAVALRQAVMEAGEPEFINHGNKTHPKARLLNLNVGYKETADGPILLEKIGIPTIKAACPHFAAWLDRLQALSADGLAPAEP
jgi:hypothetical protein